MTVNAVVLWRIEQMAVILKICILEKETRTKLDIVSRQFNESDPNLHLKPQQATRTALLSLVGMLYRMLYGNTLLGGLGLDRSPLYPRFRGTYCEHQMSKEKRENEQTIIP